MWSNFYSVIATESVAVTRINKNWIAPQIEKKKKKENEKEKKKIEENRNYCKILQNEICDKTVELFFI